jgi:hypothetical protein
MKKSHLMAHLDYKETTEVTFLRCAAVYLCEVHMISWITPA